MILCMQCPGSACLLSMFTLQNVCVMLNVVAMLSFGESRYGKCLHADCHGALSISMKDVDIYKTSFKKLKMEAPKQQDVRLK